MKKSFIALLIAWSNLFGQASPFPDVRFMEGKVYLVARGTKSKQSLISKNFNSVDSNITHVGLGYHEPIAGGLTIYSISTEKKKSNALLVENIHDFMSPKDIF